MKNKGLSLIVLIIIVVIILVLIGVTVKIVLNNTNTIDLKNQQQNNNKTSIEVVPSNKTSDDYLAKCASVGDFVSYNAGIWAGGEGKLPTEEYSFGGNILGQSRNLSLEYNSNKCEYNGWRILNVDNNGTPTDYSDDIITLIHAGFSEYFKMGNNAYDSAKILNEALNVNEYPSEVESHDFGSYIDEKYATKATSLSAEILKDTTDIDITKIENNSSLTSNELIKIGRSYFLATPKSETSLWIIDNNGKISNVNADSLEPIGVRAVVYLKAGIKTITEKVKDTLNENNTNGMWKLK